MDITTMKKRSTESEREFWERKVAADPDVIITDRNTVRVLHRPGESPEEYSARLQAAAPPLPDEAKTEIRNASDEYWAHVDQRERERKQSEAGKTY